MQKTKTSSKPVKQQPERTAVVEKGPERVYTFGGIVFRGLAILASGFMLAIGQSAGRSAYERLSNISLKQGGGKVVPMRRKNEA